MLLIRQLQISNFACFDEISISPSTDPNRPLTVIRAENGSGKTTLLRAIRWGMYGEKGLPGESRNFSLHPADWHPDKKNGIETSVSILFETDGSSRSHPHGRPVNQVYELRRSVKTIAREPSSPGEPDFRRMDETAQLLLKQSDGSWLPEEGVDKVIDELLPLALQDFFVMDADEAADFVGGSENKIIERRDVIKKTSFAVSALLGLEVFQKAIDRVRSVSDDFGRQATKAAGDKKLSEMQAELDRLRGTAANVKTTIEQNQHTKADIHDRLERARGQLETLIGNLGAHDQLRERLKENESRRKKIIEKRRDEVGALSEELSAIDFLASITVQEITQVRNVLQPLYDDGSIPIRHLTFVQGLLEQGKCVCGQNLGLEGEYREHLQRIVEQSRGKEEGANYLSRVLHAANALHRQGNDEDWRGRCDERAKAIADLDEEVAVLDQVKRDIDKKLDAIDNERIENTRDEIAMLEGQSEKLERELVSDKDKLKEYRQKINQLEGFIRTEHRRQSEARDLEAYRETAVDYVSILDRAYERIRDDQVNELSREMNKLFVKMAEDVSDDDGAEEERHKSTLRMIAKVGLQPLDGTSGEYEIFALNSRGRSMPPTEINGASRRILALSFVLGLCNVSRTLAPLVADSLLNFTSGSVRTNTLRVTAETARQPILLLTGSDLESKSEVDLVQRYAGVTYTLTGQWQHITEGGDVIHQTVPSRVSLICPCSPREFCGVCERRGQADNPAFNRRQNGVQNE